VSDKVRISRYEVQGGGQIATAMVACSRLGLRTKFLGKVGDDDAGRLSVALLEREGVEASGVRIAAGVPTQVAFIMVDKDSGERTVVWSCDEASVLRPAELSREEIVQARVLHVDATGLAAGLLPLRWAREASVVTSIDLDLVAPWTEEALGLVDLCVVPESFARELTGRADPDEAIRLLQRINPEAIVCVTLGAKGCIAIEGEQLLREPAIPIAPVVDTTACGDVFHAAFIWSALAGLPLARSMRFANAAAALKTRALGGRPGIPRLHEVEQLLEGR
jgi:sugar/nucleoside kinase (ribokinase family)